MNLLFMICGGITIGFSILHLLLLGGAPLGEFVLGGKFRVIPWKRRWVNALLMVIFCIIGGIYLVTSQSRPIPSYCLFIIICYTIFLSYAIYEKIFITKSKKETYLLAPLSAISFLCSVFGLLL